MFVVHCTTYNFVMSFTRFPRTVVEALFRFSIAIGVSLIFAANTGSVFAQRAIGIDVSGYQSASLNWTTIKGYGVSFGWAKATEGTGFSDSTFVGNINNAKAAGIYIGAYHYAHPEQNTASSEASYFWSKAGPYITADGMSLMPMLDIESHAHDAWVGASSLSDWINQWCTDVIQQAANAGVAIKPCIYISSSNASGWLNGTVTQWNNDIADWPYAHATAASQAQAASGPPAGFSPWGTWQFWQYDDQNVAQAYTTGDGDIFNGTVAQLAATMLATASTASTIYYWDPQGTNGANPYTGSMSQTWENAKWSYGATGLGSPVNWTEGKAACFGVHTGNGTPAYTITMNADHVVAGFFDGPLTPNSCDVTITGSGTIQLASGAQGLDAHNASDGSLGLMRINVPIFGDGVMYPEGNGQSFLNATNGYTGGTILGYSSNPFSGIVNFNNGYAFGTGPITLWNKGTGGALVYTGAGAATVTNDVIVQTATTNNIVGNAAGLTFSGNWYCTNLLTLGGGATAGKQTIISGVISGASGITVTNLGTIVFSGVNTYSGTTTINSPAVLTIGDPGQLGSGSYAGNIVNNGTFNYNSTAAQTLSGTISGTGPLKVAGGGTLVLTHANTFTGTVTVSNASTLCVTADTALGAAANALTLNNGCLKNNNSAPTINSGRTITLGAGGGYLDAGWAPSNPLTIAARLSGSGALLINMDGSPVVLANTANNYTGNTVIGTNGPGYYAVGTQALLKAGASAVIPNGSGKGNMVIYGAWSGIFDLAGTTQSINGLLGDGIVDNTSGNGSLSVGNNNVSSTFSGVIQDTVGALALTKVGTGTLTLAVTNTYSGGTTISAGTLALGSTGSIDRTPGLTIAAGATFDVSAMAAYALSGSTTLNANGAALPATIKGATTVDLGSRPIVLAYDGTHPALTISQGALSLNGNAIAVNGAVLPVGIYSIIQQTTGNVSASGVFAISGTAIGAGKTASISVVGGNVNLVISEPSTFAGLSSSQSITYGTPSVTLAGKVSGAGPVYPANGETITVTINGNAQATTINDSTGDFSINYNPSTIPASGSPYTISYSYSGDSALNPSSDTTTTLTINPRNIVLSIESNGDGTYTLNFVGAPNTAYYILSTSDVTQPLSSWTPVPNSTNTSGNDGSWSFMVSNAAPAFYRATVNPSP
jgi:autotransporter-associated beta strand protein